MLTDGTTQNLKSPSVRIVAAMLIRTETRFRDVIILTFNVTLAAVGPVTNPVKSKKLIFWKADMEARKVSFTDTDKTSVLTVLRLPGNLLNPPKYLQRRGKLYEYRGSGLGGDVPVNFYREVASSFLCLD